MEPNQDHHARAAQLIAEVRNSPEAKEVEALGLAIASMVMDSDNALMPAVVEEFQNRLMELIPRSQEELLRAHVFFEQGEEGRSREMRYALQDELDSLENQVQHVSSIRRHSNRRADMILCPYRPSSVGSARLLRRRIAVADIFTAADRRKEVIRHHHRKEQALDSLIDMRQDLPTSWKTAAKAVLRDRAGFHGVTNASILSITAEKQERGRVSLPFAL